MNTTSLRRFSPLWLPLLGLVLAGCNTQLGLAPTPALTPLPTPPLLAAPGIEGRVTDADGRGLDTIQVESLTTSAVQLSFTDVNGYFTDPLSAGTYVLRFIDPLGEWAGGYLGTTGMISSSAAARTFTVGTTATTGVTVILPAGRTISGRLVLSGQDDRGGYLIAAVTADVTTLVDDEAGAPTPGTARTGADGSFVLRGLPAGKYALAAWSPDGALVGYASPSGWAMHAAAGVAVDVRTQNVAGLILPAATPPAAQNYRVSGTVRDEQGRGVARVVVHLAPATGAVQEVRAADDGTYVLGDVAPGTYTLTVDGDYYRIAAGAVITAPLVVTNADLTGVDLVPYRPPDGLWSRLPTTVGGVPLTVRQTAGGFVNPQILTNLGKTTADITAAAFARDHPEVLDARAATISIDATQIAGVTADQLRQGWLAWAQAACTDCTVQGGTVSGKMVDGATLAGYPGGDFMYATGDTMFEISLRDVGQLDAAVAALP